VDSFEERILAVIDQNRESIIEFGRDIYTHAELGYKEFRTAQKFSEFLKKLNLQVVENLAVTGVKGYLKGGEQDVTVALIGELDALRIPQHPFADPETGAAHCCGHHAQLGLDEAAVLLLNGRTIEGLDDLGLALGQRVGVGLDLLGLDPLEFVLLDLARTDLVELVRHNGVGDDTVNFQGLVRQQRVAGPGANRNPPVVRVRLEDGRIAFGQGSEDDVRGVQPAPDRLRPSR